MAIKNWNSQVPIADISGKPTPEFMRWLSEQLKVNNAVNSATPQARKIDTTNGLTGGGDLTNDITLSLSDIGTAGTYGDTSHVPRITTDAQGRVIEVEELAIASSGGSGGGQPFWFNPPKVANVTKFDPLNAGLTIVDDTDIGLICNFTKPPIDCGFQGVLVQLPDRNADWTFELHFIDNYSGQEYWGVMGVALLDLIAGKVFIDGHFPNYSTYPDMSSEAYNYPSGWVTNVRSKQKQRFTENFIKVVHSGGNLYFYRSNNGKTYQEVFGIGDTTYTPNKPQYVGFGSSIGGSAAWDYQISIDRFVLA